MGFCFRCRSRQIFFVFVLFYFCFIFERVFVAEAGLKLTDVFQEIFELVIFLLCRVRTGVVGIFPKYKVCKSLLKSFKYGCLVKSPCCSSRKLQLSTHIRWLITFCKYSSRNLSPSSGLQGHLYSSAYIQTWTYTHTHTHN